MVDTKNRNQDTSKMDNEVLILYRLDRVESAVKEVGTKVDRQDNIKRSDLKEFQDTLAARLIEFRVDLQSKINDKADQTQVDDLRALVKWAFGLMSSVVGGLVLYYLTRQG
jgi:hypothetical protein